jgi:proteasome lid subunit RPN8/RPN11
VTDPVVIASAVVDAIVAHARAAAPRECCGLLVGTAGRIDNCVSTRNVDTNPSRFRVDPAAHIALNRQLRGTGRAVIGVYHSHPASRAEPSPSDIDEAYYPDFVHVIVSLVDRSDASIRAYRIVSGQVHDVVLESASRRTRT